VNVVPRPPGRRPGALVRAGRASGRWLTARRPLVVHDPDSNIHAQDTARVQATGDRSVALGPAVGDAPYAAALAEHLPAAFAEGRPDRVFYVAGDPG